MYTNIYTYAHTHTRNISYPNPKSPTLNPENVSERTHRTLLGLLL